MRISQKALNNIQSGSEEITEENYKKVTDSVFGLQSTVQDVIQKVVLFGLTHAQINGSNNFEVWNYVMAKASASYGNGLRTATLKDYIKALAFDRIKWAKNKKGELCFQKVTKNTKVQYVSQDSELARTPWYNLNKKGQAKPEITADAFLKSTLTRAEGLLKGDKLKDGEEDRIQSIINGLKELTQSITPDPHEAH